MTVAPARSSSWAIPTPTPRLVPVIVRDSRRLAVSQRCRPGAAPSRVRLMRAASAGVLDRALDVAAALEVRGYGAARRAPRGYRPWSRHDVAFTTAAVALVALAVAARIAGAVPFTAYPRLHAPVSGSTVAVALGLLSSALLPFADRRGIER